MLIKSIKEKILSVQFSKNKKPHKHKWKPTRMDAYGGQRYICKTCGSEGVKNPRYHGDDIKVLVWSEKAQQLPHEHQWCFEYRGGRKKGASEDTPMSAFYSCECGQWAVRHFGEDEYQLLK